MLKSMAQQEKVIRTTKSNLKHEQKCGECNVQDLGQIPMTMLSTVVVTNPLPKLRSLQP